MQLDGVFQTSDDIRYNARVKYRQKNGTFVPYEIMVSNRQTFRQSGAEVSDYTVAKEWREAYDKANAELFGGAYGSPKRYKPAPMTEEEVAAASRGRARRKLFDLIMCNEDLDTFVTLTLDGEKIDRCNYDEVVKKVGTYLDNRVRRQGLLYCGVPEKHKNGGLHFHFVMNGNALKLVDSGTVSIEGRKAPIKIATAKRLHIPPEEWHTVYNVEDWELGFSTAIRCYGQRGALAQYMIKELVKQMYHGGKCGGRWYYSGGKLARPKVELARVDYDSIGTYSAEYECPGCKFKVIRLDDDGTPYTE